ncbi:GVQW3 [Cordylochernes scorpioides]|uniref:GVQW3 n=1 Tax=Cordylochernes scorpioides TaxID=51811 RepID=A0ABY6K7I9_9ARAC|nr:GVQW3 [Cordylochernes scorpioides]
MENHKCALKWDRIENSALVEHRGDTGHNNFNLQNPRTLDYPRLSKPEIPVTNYLRYHQLIDLDTQATETFEMLNKAFPNDALKRTTVFEWHSRFKAGRISIEVDPRQGRPKFQRTDENVQKITDLIKENP